MTQLDIVHASFGDSRAVAVGPTVDVALGSVVPWIAMQCEDNMYAAFSIGVSVVPGAHVTVTAHIEEWLDMPPDLLNKKEVLQ